jgi:hypothetical protein
VVVRVDEGAMPLGQFANGPEVAPQMAWRVMMPKKISMFSHEQLVGVKRKVIRWFSGA